MRRLQHRWYIVPAVVVLAVAAFAAVGALHHSSSSESSGTTSASAGSGAAAEPAKMLDPMNGSPTLGANDAAGVGSSKASSSSNASSQSPSTLFATYAAARGRYLIRDGYLTMVVRRGQLQAVVARMTSLTAIFNGYVVSSFVGTADGGGVVPLGAASQGSTGATQSSGSSTSNAEPMIIAPGAPYATLTVRIPAAKFDQAVARFGALGTVKQVSSSSTDVTSQYVDLNARLQHYQAVERELLTFLARATTVGQALAVQDRINNTQITVEELTAQIKQLNETIAYSTLTVTLSEKQPVAAAVVSSGTFGGALRHSLRLIADGAQVTFVALGAVAPFAALLAVVAVIGWILIKRFGGRRRQVPPAAPPALEA